MKHFDTHNGSESLFSHFTLFFWGPLYYLPSNSQSKIMIRSTDTLRRYEDDDVYDDENRHDDLDKDAQQKLRAPPDWDGPVQNRQCTDSACLLLLLIALVVFGIIGVYSRQEGDARVIVYPMDYDGNICGLDLRGVDMTDFPYLYYVNSYTGGVCVESCPEQGVDMRTLITYDGIWQAENATLSSDFLSVADYSLSENLLSCTEEDCFPNNSVEESWDSVGINRGLGYAYYVGDSYPLFRRCYLTSDSEVEIAELTGSATTKAIDFVNPWETHAFWTNLYGDLWTARFVILGFGFGASLLLSLIYVGLLRIPCLLSGVIWASILAVIGVFAIGGYYAYTLAEEWSQEDPLPSVRPEQIKYTEITSYVLFGISALCVLFACCFRNSIQTAVRCVRESGRAINRMVLLFGVPFIQGVLLLVFWVAFGYVSAHLASLGEVTTRTFPVDLDGTQVSMRVFEFDDFTKYCGWYLLFIFFWVASFILAIGDLTVALAVSRWYFTVSKRRVNSYWVLGSLWTTFRYHLGTLAFGSLLVAIVRLLRAILLRVQRTITAMTNKKIANMMLCCCQCCLCCLERILKFINKNAYIQCAIFGTPFWESGRQACFLIVRQVGRVGTLSYVSWAVLIMGKILISTLTTVLAYYTVVEYESDILEEALYSYGGPMIVIFCISFFLASMFMGVFDTSILTILHCFAADEEMFEENSNYTDKNFRKWIDEQEDSERKR